MMSYILDIDHIGNSSDSTVPTIPNDSDEHGLASYFFIKISDFHHLYHLFYMSGHQLVISVAALFPENKKNHRNITFFVIYVICYICPVMY